MFGRALVNTFTIKPILRSEIPNNATVWWSLRPPAAAGNNTQPLILKLVDDRDSVSLDLSGPLNKANTTFVKFNGSFNQATLSLDGKTITTQTW